jgi:pimeloyl-ACP methyl ester carboxylesterase
MLWGEEDPVLPPAAGDALARRLNRPPPERIAGASHFLQEDAGERIGATIADWLAG